MTDYPLATKPAELAESRLIQAILDGDFPIDSNLPAERELAQMLGVTRPTLREALQRLGRDGWVHIQHGKPTRVRNYWEEGNLAVLGAIAAYPAWMPPDFVHNLLVVRQLLAPTYTRLAATQSPERVCVVLEELRHTPDRAVAYAMADFRLHHTLTVASGNPVFTLILNGFADAYHTLGQVYFSLAEGRASSRRYYDDLLAAMAAGDVDGAGVVTEQAMVNSLRLWPLAARAMGLIAAETSPALAPAPML